MDKIYDALRKLSSKSSKAQNTNSEYFVIGMLSDHTSNEMACHSNHLYVLTHNNQKNLYTLIEQASSFSDLRNIVDKAKVYTNKQ